MRWLQWGHDGTCLGSISTGVKITGDIPDGRIQNSPDTYGTVGTAGIAVIGP